MKKLFLASLTLGLSLLAGCGKYGPPLPPEAVSPTTVAELAASAARDSVSLSWRSPSDDRRGKTLSDIEGYRVYRKTIIKRGDIYDDSVQYALLSEIKDDHLKNLKIRKDEAEARGEPTRRIKSDPKETEFSFTDSSVKAGESYIYKIAPVNHGGVEGRSAKLIRADFSGEKPESSLIENLQDTRLDLKSRVEIK